MPADGDCAFASIVAQLHKCVASSFEQGQHLEHLKLLGLGMKDIKADSYTLHQPFVDNIQSAPDYLGLLGVPPESAFQETEHFRQAGIFSGNVSDIVVKVCADIVVITSMAGSPHVPFIPENVRSSSPLFLAFNASRPGHYDGTKEAAGELFSVAHFCCVV